MIEYEGVHDYTYSYKDFNAIHISNSFDLHYDFRWKAVPHLISVCIAEDSYYYPNYQHLYILGKIYYNKAD